MDMFQPAAAPEKQKHKFGRFIKIAALTLLAVVVIGIGSVLLLAPKDWISHLASDKGTSALGRSFRVEGDIKIHWDWTQPYIEAHQIKLANMPNAPESDMVDIDQVNFHIKIWKLLEGQLNLPDITLVQPKIILEKFDPDTKNWDFPTVSKASAVTHAALPNKRSNFPIIGTIAIQGGQLTYRDKTVGLDTTLNIDTASGSSQDSLTFTGAGVLHDQKFSLKAGGGSLDMMRESSEPYPLNVDIQMGSTGIKIDGQIDDPVKMDGIDMQVDIHGDNLADIFYLTGIPLPPSPVYSFSGHLQEKTDLWTFKDLKGRMGESDINGEISYDTSGQRNYMKGTIVSNLLRMEDLGGFIGAKSGDKSTVPNGKLLPDMPLNLTRLRSADVDLDFRATKINQPGWPIENMNTHFGLKDGVLRIDPLSFGVANGKISGSLMLNGQKDIPSVAIDLMLEGLSLKPFFSDSRFETLSEGHFGGRFQIAGDGKSLADVLGDSNGRVTMLMAGGAISKLIVDAAGLDIAKAVPALLGKDQKAGIRCAIGDFGVKDGLLASDIFVFDTTASKIQGKANINLKDESMNIKIEGEPKDVTISGQIPITITGAMRHPSIGLSTVELAERGGAAAALSAVLTPLAAVLPFINVDPAKDADCAALINAAGNNSGVTPEDVTAPKK